MNSSHAFPIVLALLLSSLCMNGTLAQSAFIDELSNPNLTINQQKWHRGTPNGICHTSVASFYGAIVLAIMWTVHFTFVG
uniref:Transmembrane protein n=1 Tax=Globodera rostochiensis TaxID=31243 RepID=A0A914H671_GLORO